MNARGRKASEKNHGGELEERSGGNNRVTREPCILNLVENYGSKRRAWDLSASRSPVMT